MKKYYIALGAVALIITGVFLLRNGEEEQVFAEVQRGEIVQEIFETGSTEKGEDVRAGFKEGGRIEKVLIKEGKEIAKGEVIAELDKNDLRISLREARASLASAEANLQKLLEGATAEELSIARAAVKAAETALDSAKDNLEEQKKVTDETLSRAYQDITTLLGDIFSMAKETTEGIRDISSTYFTGSVVSETTSGRISVNRIRQSLSKIEEYKDLAMKGETNLTGRKEALSKTGEELEKMVREMDNLISVADSNFYKDRFSDEDKKNLRTYRNNVNGYLNRTVSLLGNISSVRADIDAKLTSARGSVNSAERTLEQAEKELSKVKADPGDADIKSARASIDQAKARLDRVKRRIEDAVLRSPVTGVISSVLAREGEVISVGSSVAIIVPEEDIQVAVDIYEGDVSKIDIGNSATASFVAFPEENFTGEVVFINPTGKVIDGVVYYETKIVLDEYPENTLPQMTVDVTIKTAQKEGVLFLPERFVQRKEGKRFVNVLENGEIVQREVKTGLSGEGRVVEIVSGLKEGEKVFNN